MVLLKSMLLGLAVAAPVGPIGLLCVQRTLMYGRRAGLYSGLGAATADMVYAVFAAFGFVVVSALLSEYALVLQLLGSLFLLYLGWRMFGTPEAREASTRNVASLWMMYVSTFVLTVTNPLTIASFVAMFAGIGMDAANGWDAFTLVVGVFFGSSVWWFFLSLFVARVGRRLSPTFLRTVNRTAGGLVIALGLFGAWHSLLG